MESWSGVVLWVTSMCNQPGRPPTTKTTGNPQRQAPHSISPSLPGASLTPKEIYLAIREHFIRFFANFLLTFHRQVHSKREVEAMRGGEAGSKTKTLPSAILRQVSVDKMKLFQSVNHSQYWNSCLNLNYKKVDTQPPIESFFEKPLMSGIGVLHLIQLHHQGHF